jgi:hypothetical protein
MAKRRAHPLGRKHPHGLALRVEASFSGEQAYRRTDDETERPTVDGFRARGVPTAGPLVAECRAAVATCRITSLLRQASRNLLRGMVQRTDRWPCRRAARSLPRSASESRPRSRQPAALAFRRRCCLSSSARTPPTPAGTLAFARRSGSQAEPERQLSRLVQLGSRGGPGEDSRIREEENDDRRLSVLPQSGRSPCCKIRARGCAAGF